MFTVNTFLKSYFLRFGANLQKQLEQNSKFQVISDNVFLNKCFRIFFYLQSFFC